MEVLHTPSLQIVEMSIALWQRDCHSCVVGLLKLKTVSIMEFHFLLPNITASPGSLVSVAGAGRRKPIQTRVDNV